MNKNEYLDSPDVRNFINWFAKAIVDEGIAHSYLQLKPKKYFRFNGLQDALAQYYWKRRNFTSTVNLLNELKAQIRNGWGNSSYTDVVTGAQRLMKWGGTEGNNKWFEQASSIESIKSDIHSLEGENICLVKISRFNSGLTKFYSLLLNDFIIYDSRVAAALQWFILKWCTETDQKEIPNLLNLGSTSLRGSQTRNASSAQYVFQKIERLVLSKQPIEHVNSNIKANLLLVEVLKEVKANKSAYHEQKLSSPLHALEAALFMWGYDLTESMPNSKNWKLTFNG